MHGRKNDSAGKDWNQAEDEIRKRGRKTEPKPEAKAEPQPEAKAEPKPEAKAKAKPKPEAKVEPQPEKINS